MRRGAAALGIVVASLVSLSAPPASRPAFAQGADVVAVPEPDTSYRAGEPETLVLGLGLEQAKQLGVAHSPRTRGALASLRRARGLRMTQAGAFDPVLFAANERISTDSPVASPFAASELRVRSLSAGASWLSPIGTAITLGVVQNRTESNAPFTTLPRERRAHARLDLVQPLLRGFGPAATWGELRATEHELEAARLQLAAARLDVDSDVENAYWELYAAERNLEVQRLLRQRAAIFLRQQMLRGRAGAVGPGTVAIARTFMADQEAFLLDTQLRLGDASDRLAEVMGVAPDRVARYHSLDVPPPPGSIEPLEVVLERALQTNGALQAAAEEVRASEARWRRAARNAWPSIDAFGGYGGSGLAGTGRRIVFGSDTTGADFDTDFGEAWDQVFGDDHPDWSFGVRVDVPIGWRSDRGERERRLGEMERERETLRARQLALATAVRDVHREVDQSHRQLQVMNELRAAAEEQARIARLEFQAGRTTTYEVVNLEADLARAEFRVSEVLVRVARARTELRRLTTPISRRTER
ncbi:MAG TPA: TolC family protein [Candidatus Limnocylindria bacterium]|nr:TolC family protein [Candidatus Limnocylindria bacterium]